MGGKEKIERGRITDRKVGLSGRIFMEERRMQKGQDRMEEGGWRKVRGGWSKGDGKGAGHSGEMLMRKG